MAVDLSSSLTYHLALHSPRPQKHIYPTGKLSGRGPTQTFRQQESLRDPGGPAWRSQLYPSGHPEWVWARPWNVDPAGEPWPSSPRDVPLQLCQVTCSLLERAVLTLWFPRHGLPATGGWGGGVAWVTKGGWETLLCVGPLNFLWRGNLFNVSNNMCNSL